MTVTFPNNPPVANDDFVTVSSGQSIRIKIGLNDTDEDGDALASSIVTNATQGTTSLVDNSNFYDIVNYTPNENAIGTDSFVYQITDGKGGSNSAVVFITIESSPEVSGSEVYRFFDTINNTHFFSTDEFEANHILINLPHYRLEGPAFQAADPINGPTKDVFRFFNTQSGTHLFTQDENERDHIINNSNDDYFKYAKELEDTFMNSLDSHLHKYSSQSF